MKIFGIMKKRSREEYRIILKKYSHGIPDSFDDKKQAQKFADSLNCTLNQILIGKGFVAGPPTVPGVYVFQCDVYFAVGKFDNDVIEDYQDQVLKKESITACFLLKEFTKNV